MRVGVPLLAIFVVVGAAWINFYPEQQPIQKPIIAQLYADPSSFSGRMVEVYGLVVESSKNEFLLQDVSQRPLRVLGSAAIGDQVTVVGRFYASSQSIYLTAERLIPTKVTGGGGCC